MTHLITAPAGIVYSRAISIAPPDTDGLVAVFNGGGSLRESLRNWISWDAAPFTYSGTPGVLADSLSLLGNTDFLHTGIAETEALTWLCVARSSGSFLGNANSPEFISNFGTDPVAGITNTNLGTRLAFVGQGTPTAPNGILQARTTWNNAGTPKVSGPTVSVPAADTYRAMAKTIAPGVRHAVWNLTANNKVEANGDVALPRQLNTSNRLRIGSGHNANAANGGPCDMSFALFYTKSKTDAQIAILYAWMKAFVAAHKSQAV